MQSFDKNQRFVGNVRVLMVSVVVTFCDDSGYGKFDYGYTIYMYLSDSDNGSGYCNNSDRNHSGYVLNMIMVVVIIVKVLTMVCS